MPNINKNKKVPDKPKKGKAHEIYGNQESFFYEFIAKAVQLKISPTEIVAELHKYTNISIYHLASAFPHIECCYSHEEKVSGLLIKAIEPMNEGQPTDCHQSLSSDLKKCEIWNDSVYQLFLYHPGKSQTDIHKAVKNLFIQ